ncbi:LLM class flavin-dependent oxidoreductase [Rhodococcoides yunnanense]|uniref:LLM class flavin-dependent oxidoreductase n=1 Tax=Rhodococcoides yunnanense TaxID=278209 RepID=UPI0009349278|nr:LLM class flavin-dependent oxidoreductase [Rhodococcus yunnanensis]
MDLGLITFGTLLADPHTGTTVTQRQRVQEVVDTAVRAERLGYAWYAVGEHHFRDRDVIPNPTLVLAAIAERTSSIRLATATTLVANRDPVLLAEDYALLDILSEGRLELVAGGSFFPEPYVVFGQDPGSKAARKRENLDLLIKLWTQKSVTWSGKFRPPLNGITVQPRPLQTQPPLWASAGTDVDSVALAVEHRLPIAFGTTAHAPSTYVDAFAAYRDLWQKKYSDAPGRQAAASHTFVARTSQEARSQWASYIGSYLSARPNGGPVDFDAHIGPSGPALCGSPAEVLDKLGNLRQLWGHDLHLLAVDIGGIPHSTVESTVELIATAVLPQAKKLAATARVRTDA